MLVDGNKLNNKLDKMIEGIDKDTLDCLESNQGDEAAMLQGIKAVLNALKESVIDGKYTVDE